MEVLSEILDPNRGIGMYDLIGGLVCFSILFSGLCIAFPDFRRDWFTYRK